VPISALDEFAQNAFAVRYIEVVSSPFLTNRVGYQIAERDPVSCL